MPNILDLIEDHLQPHPTDAASDWHRDLETQVMYDDGTRARVPKYDRPEPYFHGSEVYQDFAKQVRRIGTSGWNWVDRHSEYVKFDFDLKGEHKGHTVEADTLAQIREAAEKLPYMTVYSSTSGEGLHLKVAVDQIRTDSPAEHRDLAEYVLDKMCKDAQFDFREHIDVYGSIFWVWGRGCKGPRLLKPAAESLEVPYDWRQFLPAPPACTNEIDSQFSNMEFDAEHEAILQALLASGYTTFVSGNRLTTHTCALRDVHQQLGLRGTFATNSPGTDRRSPNCFVHLKTNGAMEVYRYGQGTREHDSWTQDGRSWTHCSFNATASVAGVCEAMGAMQVPGGWYFPVGKHASAALQQLGHELPKTNRPVTVEVKGNTLHCSVDRVGNEQVKGWAPKGRKLYRIFKHQIEERSYDDFVRKVITPSGESAGWAVDSDRGWNWVSQSEAQHVLTERLGRSVSLARCITRPWERVNEPFADEFLPGRRWNVDGARLRYTPTAGGATPHWDRIFQHLGRGLDSAVSNCDFCAEHGIRSGAKYLQLWVACLFQQPKQRLPVLFFYSQEQDTGKSSLHRALALLMSKGCVDGSNALTQGFNGELNGAIVCYIDEKNLAANPKAYESFKRWSDAPDIPIRQMHTNQFTSPNYTHWIQTANNRDFCPIEKGDRRFVVVEVSPLEDPIAWSILREKLIAEAPDFLGNVLAMPLPPADGRLFLPVLETEAKIGAIGSGSRPGVNADALQEALQPWCGMEIKTSQLFDQLPAGMVSNAISLGRQLEQLGHEKLRGGEWLIQCG